jgi:hypothetical protein
MPIESTARRVLRRAATLAERQGGAARYRGFLYVRIAGKWCAGWYDVYADAVTLTSGVAQARARRLVALPPRFEAIYLLFKLARANTPGMVCHTQTR